MRLESMPVAQFTVRPATANDAQAMAALFAAVAGERTGIATEPPVDIDERVAQFARTVAGSVVAVADGQIVGLLHIDASPHGFGELGMLVDRGWRGLGVGSALIQAAISWARGRGLHKLCLEVFAHNTGAIALYRKSGFVEEGRRIGQYRRASGELWDSIVMGRTLLAGPASLITFYAGPRTTGATMGASHLRNWHPSAVRSQPSPYRSLPESILATLVGMPIDFVLAVCA